MCFAQASGEACGLAQTNIEANSSSTTCGKFLGYWTADEVCALNPTYSSAPYTCNLTADGGATFAQMFGCVGWYGESCYILPNVTQCCGCVNWTNVPTDPTIVPQCTVSGNGSSNPFWVMNALPTLQWYHNACPANYIYPFDDKSSTFTCSNVTSSVKNNVNYTITFCPGGHTSAPSGTILSMSAV